MKTMTAKYAGKCRACGGRIEAGDTIRWSRAAGANHADSGVCQDFGAFVAEESAEREFFGRADRHDFSEFEAEGALIACEEAEYQRGYHEVAAIQAISAPGSAWRDALYAEMEMAAYNRGEDY